MCLLCRNGKSLLQQNLQGTSREGLTGWQSVMEVCSCAGCASLSIARTHLTRCVLERWKIRCTCAGCILSKAHTCAATWLL